MPAFLPLKLTGLVMVGFGLLFQGCNESADVPGFVTKAVTPRVRVEQPIAFDHETHIKAEDMDCKDCHRFADKGPYATLPRLKDCADCHSELQGENPEEKKVMQYLEDGKEIPWVRVNRLPGHVYFSHRAHVAFGEMKCWDCHGDMRKVSQPVTESDIDYLSMSKCIACHQERKVENACSTCHK